MNSFRPTEPHSLALLLLLAAVVWFSNLEYRKLADPDEGRYAEIPREMVVGGDWITPRLNAIKYFEKPPLQYWATAAAYEAFGVHHWTARLWPALTGFVGLLVVFLMGSRLFGRDAGLYAALVLGSGLAYVGVAHFLVLDMGLTFFTTLGLAGFLAAQSEGASPREQRYGMWTAWAALALAVLSKGLVGIVLPGLALVIYSLLQRDAGRWLRLHFASGLAIFLLIAAPWFIAVSARNPEFPGFFFIHEHFARFATDVEHRSQLWWFFVPVLVVGLVPWTVTALDALVRAWRDDAGAPDNFRPRRFLLVWVGCVFLFFTLSHSKLPAYILPLFPALALLAGDRLARLPSGALKWHMAPMAVFAAAGLLLGGQVDHFSSHIPGDLLRQYVPWMTAAAALMLIVTVIGLTLARRQRAWAVVVFSLGGLGAAQLLMTGLECFSPENSGYGMARAVAGEAGSELPFYSVETYEQSLPFYLARPITLVAVRDEFEFGLEQEPDKALPDLEAFVRAWNAQPQAFALMKRTVYRDLAREGIAMRQVAGNRKYVIARKS